MYVTFLVSFSPILFSKLLLGYINSLLFTDLNLKFHIAVMQKGYKT